MSCNCDVIMDLLPLYVDGVASRESARTVKEHLKTCTSCKEYYKIHREAIPAPQEIIGESDMDYARLAKRMRHRRLWIYAGILSYISISICVTVALWLQRKKVKRKTSS